MLQLLQEICFMCLTNKSAKRVSLVWYIQRILELELEYYHRLAAVVCIKTVQKQRQGVYSFPNKPGAPCLLCVHTGIPSSGGKIVQSIRLIWHFHLMPKSRIKLYQFPHIHWEGLGHQWLCSVLDKCHWQNYDFMNLITLGFRLLPQVLLQLWSSLGVTSTRTSSVTLKNEAVCSFKVSDI